MNPVKKKKTVSHLNLFLLARGSCFATSTSFHTTATPAAASLLSADTTLTNTKCPTVLLGTGQCLCPCSWKPGRMFLLFIFPISLLCVEADAEGNLVSERQQECNCKLPSNTAGTESQVTAFPCQFVPAVLEVTASYQGCTLYATESNAEGHPARGLWAVSTPQMLFCTAILTPFRVVKVSGFLLQPQKSFSPPKSSEQCKLKLPHHCYANSSVHYIFRCLRGLINLC